MFFKFNKFGILNHENRLSNRIRKIYFKLNEHEYVVMYGDNMIGIYDDEQKRRIYIWNKISVEEFEITNPFNPEMVLKGTIKDDHINLFRNDQFNDLSYQASKQLYLSDNKNLYFIYKNYSGKVKVKKLFYYPFHIQNFLSKNVFENKNEILNLIMNEFFYPHVYLESKTKSGNVKINFSDGVKCVEMETINKLKSNFISELVENLDENEELPLSELTFSEFNFVIFNMSRRTLNVKFNKYYFFLDKIGSLIFQEIANKFVERFSSKSFSMKNDDYSLVLDKIYN